MDLTLNIIDLILGITLIIAIVVLTIGLSVSLIRRG